MLASQLIEYLESTGYTRNTTSMSSTDGQRSICFIRMYNSKGSIKFLYDSVSNITSSFIITNSDGITKDININELISIIRDEKLEILC